MVCDLVTCAKCRTSKQESLTITPTQGSNISNSCKLNVQAKTYDYILISCITHMLVLLYSSRAAYYGVFDGHAGPRASQFAADYLHKNIVSRFPKGSSGCLTLYVTL